MRTRSLRGLSVLAASVAVSTSVGLAGATAASAASVSGRIVKPAETTVCNNSGMRCTNISSLLLNQGNGPDFIQNASSWGSVGGTDQGRKVNLRQASDTRINEDFILTKVGPLSQLCSTGGANALDPTSYACLNFPPAYSVYQAQFAPDGDESGFCVGAMSATLGFKIRLERCGTPRSFWIADLAARLVVTQPGGHHHLVYFPLEFAADTSLSNPLVLTLNTNTKSPANELFLEQENLSGGQVPDSQMFTLTDPVGPTVDPADPTP
jgi:hypothetical protein